METVVILIQFDINDRHECNAPILRPRIRVQFALHSLRGHISSVDALHVCIIKESSFMGINLQFASSGSERGERRLIKETRSERLQFEL